jgi:hypothetical protein
MNNKAALGLAMAGFAAVLTACATAQKAAPETAGVSTEPAVPMTSPADLPASGVIVGGYAPAEETDLNMQAARKVAMAQLYRVYPTTTHIANITSEVQIVEGTNYRFRIEMEGPPQSRSIYSVIVYRDLKGAMSVTQLNKIAS